MCRNFWMHSKMHSECSSTYILNALWHGPDCILAGTLVDVGMSSDWIATWILYAIWHAFCMLPAVHFVLLLIHTSWMHLAMNPECILSAVRCEFGAHSAMIFQRMMLWMLNAFNYGVGMRMAWVLSASSYGLSSWIQKSILKTTLRSECILTWLLTWPGLNEFQTWLWVH